MVGIADEDSVEPEVEAPGPVALELPKPNAMHEALPATETGQLADSQAQSDEVGPASSPCKIKRGIPSWYAGKVSPAFASHMFWPSPSKRKKMAPRELLPAAASTDTWRHMYRYKKNKTNTGTLSQRARGSRCLMSVSSKAGVKHDQRRSRLVLDNDDNNNCRSLDACDKESTTVQTKTTKRKSSVSRQRKQCRRDDADKVNPQSSKECQKHQTNSRPVDHGDHAGDTECYVCGGLFSASKRLEKKWIQCNNCMFWAHEVCVDVGNRSDGKFVCDFCN